MNEKKVSTLVDVLGPAVEEEDEGHGEFIVLSALMLSIPNVIRFIDFKLLFKFILLKDRKMIVTHPASVSKTFKLTFSITCMQILCLCPNIE